MKASFESARFIQQQKMYIVPALLPYFIILVLITSFSSISVGKTIQSELVIYGWADFMPEIVRNDFYKETGHKVKQVDYRFERMARVSILENQGDGIDLIMTSQYELNVLLNHPDIFASIYCTNLTNIRHSDPILKKKSAGVLDISVPWILDKTGILCHKNLVERETITWLDLISQPPSSSGKVMMMPAMRDVIATAPLALNKSVNSHDECSVLKAGKLLLFQMYEVLSTKITSKYYAVYDNVLRLGF